MPSGQSRVYRVIMQLRTDGVHCRESAGTGPGNLKVVPNECCLGRQVTIVAVVFTKNRSDLYPVTSLSHSSRQRNEFSWTPKIRYRKKQKTEKVPTLAKNM